jgi:thiol-activated cytolysin
MIKQLSFVLALLMVIVTMDSCKKDAAPTTKISYEDVLKSGGEFSNFNNYKNLINTSTSSVPVDSGVWTCTSNTWDVLQGNQDFPLYDPNVSVVYPGSLLQGASLNNGTPDVIAVKRGPGTVSIDIVNGSNAVYVNLPEIKKSLITQALNDIVDNNNEVLPSRFNFMQEQIKSKEELALTLGLNVEIAPVTVGADFSLSTDESMNHYLVTLKQSFYTMSYDIPTDYGDFFDPSVTPSDLDKYVSAGNPACYVSDVTYGRVFYLLIESTSSITKIKAAVNLSFSNAPISGSVEASYLSSLDSVSVKVLALGGMVANTFSAISASQLGTLTTLLGHAADIKAGVPLSYVVRTVYNNKLVKNKIAMQYTINDCELVP